MYVVIFIFFLYLVMLAYPIAIALLATRVITAPIGIQQDYTKDPRYFAHSFQKLFDLAWAAYGGGGLLQLSREELVIEADKGPLEPYTKCEAVVYAAEQDFSPSPGIHFAKEIYARGDASLVNIPFLRAIVAKGRLTLGAGTQVGRWADAEGMFKAGFGCNLGLSATSATSLVIGRDCTFQRLYAPQIYLGTEDALQGSAVEQHDDIIPIVSPEIMRDVRYIADDTAFNAKTLRSSIVSKQDVTVMRGLEVQGSIRSAKVIKINEDAIIHGNLFAEGNIYIGSNVRIFGTVFSEEEIVIDHGAIIGLKGKIKSVIAREDIVFTGEARVYGFVEARGKGFIAPTTRQRFK